MFQQPVDIHQGYWVAFKSNSPDYAILSETSATSLQGTVPLYAAILKRMMQFIQKICKSWKTPLPC